MLKHNYLKIYLKKKVFLSVKLILKKVYYNFNFTIFFGGLKKSKKLPPCSTSLSLVVLRRFSSFKSLSLVVLDMVNEVIEWNLFWSAFPFPPEPRVDLVFLTLDLCPAESNEGSRSLDFDRSFRPKLPENIYIFKIKISWNWLCIVISPKFYFIFVNSYPMVKLISDELMSIQHLM